MDDLIEDGKNSRWIVCKFCQSKVLRPSTARYEERELFLPFMQKKEDFTTENQEGETLKSHWLVPDMFAFENVGFSMTVQSIKYLACADCERGPIGWHDITDKTRFYIALERVEHKQLPQ
ncbi:unnamed protein product [Porites evermanni]|uniref:Guanine nucleotide exchange factor MSS4 n=1 Tax=Porites evermanni TaxID=104178 RepID=A0ABN8MES1_9CNID|nr:unnamed protein product [Porites evermanni]